MIFGLKFGRLGNRNNKSSAPVKPIDNSILLVKDQDGKPVFGAKVELSSRNSVFVAYTDEDGRAKISGTYGDYYVLTISGDNIETKVIEDWKFQDNYQVDVVVKPYLNLEPEYIFLCPENQYTDNVDVSSNVSWSIE